MRLLPPGSLSSAGGKGSESKLLWRVLDTGDNDGPTNMAIDEALLRLVRQGISPPTLRFYSWRPPCVTLGYFQRIEQEIDLEACRDAGIDWVRRLTGGRAVLHDRELTYSVVASDLHPVMQGSILQSYLRLSEGLLAAMRSLGLPAEIVGKEQLSRGESAVCFEAPSWYELVVDGRKLIGSAQTRKYGAVLQHGSIPLEIDVDRLYGILKLSDRAKQRLIQSFKHKAASINEILPKPVDFKVVKQAIINGFAQCFDWEFYFGELLPEEKQLLSELKEKYDSDAWNRLR